MSASLLEGGLCLLAWKKRTGVYAGLQASLSGGSRSAWEERWIVVAGTRLLYYRLGEEDNMEEPRGSIDLLLEQAEIQVSSKTSPDAPSKHEINIIAGKSTNGEKNNNGKNSTKQSSAASTTKSTSTTTLKQWKFCFHSQPDLMQFLETVHKVQDEAGHYQSKDTTRFEHDFLAGDHLYRWEMIVMPPVIYPIQIHAIVLDAGRNCVVVADFGLTGYGRKEGSKFNHADDHKTSSAILAAFKKLRPQQDQRLNIVTLTEPMEIRKWTKANYEESFFAPDSVKKLEALSKFLSRMSTRTTSKEDKAAEGVAIEGGGEPPDHSQTSSRHHPTDLEKPSVYISSQDESESSNRSAGSGMSTSSRRARRRNNHEEPLPNLPLSDPTSIVLARANFLLENEDLLPPYHVFFSNSECIAVWCKTGRWSTLQTAVFLSTNSIGAAKSATLATMGVAAAHALLAPVVAVGGLIWVGAPMLILQKSREKWEEATEMMTDLFWARAPAAVFVAAIENWSGLCHNEEEEEKEEDTDNNNGDEKLHAASDADPKEESEEQEKAKV